MIVEDSRLETAQLSRWRGQFGSEYIGRNPPTELAVRNSALAFSEILGHVGSTQPDSILEVGPNVGINLRALGQVSSAELWAVEPNASARERLISDEVIAPERVIDGHLNMIPLNDRSIDLVFTCGVLIHVPEGQLEGAYREMFRVARKYVLSIEYYSPFPTTIEYRGHSDMLFKRDFGAMWLDLFDGLTHIANGFFWDRTSGLDNVNWWLFKKQ